jgi:hypothetical protein
MNPNDHDLANNISDVRTNWHKIRNSAYGPVNNQLQHRHKFPQPYQININESPPNQTKSENMYIQKPSTPTVIKPSLSPIPSKMLPYMLKEPEGPITHIVRNNYLPPGLYKIVRPVVKPHMHYWKSI